MDKDNERKFLEFMPGALVSLPFDLKVVMEAVADADLERSVREIAAATIVHALTPKDGQVEPPLRFAEDVAQLRLALRRVSRDGGADAQDFCARFPETYESLDNELGVLEQVLGKPALDWLDGRWPQLAKAVYGKKKVAHFLDDEEASTFLYDEVSRFATDYPITEKSLSGKVKQVQSFVDHLARKREQDLKKIST